MIFRAQGMPRRRPVERSGPSLTNLFSLMTTYPRVNAPPFLLISLLCALATGCGSVHPFTRNEPVEARPVKSAAPAVAVNPRASLNAGIDAYNAGDYNGAIKRLSLASDLQRSDRAAQLEAIKYLAFSYCVTGQTSMGRLQFERALRLDPNVELAPGEKGHPLWGPVFERAKKAR